MNPYFNNIPQDTYVEANFRRRNGWREGIVIIGILLMLIMLFTVSLFVGAAMGNYAFVLYLILSFIFLYSWKFAKKLNVEYEYIFTNGVLDIDKITARDDRKTRYSLEVKEMEFFEPYENPEKYEHMKFDRIAYPCSNRKDSGLYCFAFRDRSYGHCLIVINMTDELKEAIIAARPKEYGRKQISQ